MDRMTFAAARAWPFLLACLTLAAGAPSTAGAVTLRATSATVQSPGDSGQICVLLETGGKEVAGTQNELEWDGTCATLADPRNCSEAGWHGKKLNKNFPPGREFTLRALVLSLADVEPISDGVLYCCSFISEADPGKCCNINVTNAGASDSVGHALGAQGAGGRICTAGSDSGPARGGFGRLGGDGTTSAETDVGAAPGAGVVPPPAASAGGVARPPSTVLEGGGPQVQALPETEAPGAVERAPTLAAAMPTPAPTLPPPQPPIAPPTAAATSEPTAAPTSPLPADTPTVKPTVRATAAPTAAVKAAGQQEQKSGSWFGCQVGGGGASPTVALSLLFPLAVALRRLRRTAVAPSSDTQRPQP